MKVPYGRIRARDGWMTEHSVVVCYPDDHELEIPESEYRKRGYTPPFDELPWLGEGF